VKSVLRLVIIFSVEIRSARLQPEDLKSRQGTLMREHLSLKDGGGSSGPLREACARYKPIDLMDEVLLDGTIYEMLVLGLIRIEGVIAGLENSTYFHRLSEPAYRTLWYAFLRPECEVRKALRIVRQQMEARQIVDIGEVLHLCGIMLWLSDMRAVRYKRVDVVRQMKRYVDVLLSRAKLCPLPVDDANERFDFGYGGMEFRGKDTPEYKEFFNYLKERRAKAGDRYLSGQAAMLLSVTEQDLEKFWLSCCRWAGRRRELSAKPRAIFHFTLGFHKSDACAGSRAVPRNHAAYGRSVQRWSSGSHVECRTCLVGRSA
jgi:hypothetical protein